jgi:DNA-directed RNA polymerase specialized sigma subunit
MAAISPGIASAAESVPGSVAPPDRMLDKELAGLDDQALLGLVRLSPQASERRAAPCELLVTRHQGLVRSCVRPYLRSPEPAEDLMQVGYIGLLKAISNFDPGAGCSLATYARPCISGELKRHFRDKLPAREQEILRMDFRGGMTQAQIGQRLRMSQMQVSRLRSHALGYLRSRLLDLEGTSAAMY